MEQGIVHVGLWLLNNCMYSVNCFSFFFSISIRDVRRSSSSVRDFSSFAAAIDSRLMCSLRASMTCYMTWTFSFLSLRNLSNYMRNFPLSIFVSQRSHTRNFSVEFWERKRLFEEQGPQTESPHFLQANSRLPTPKNEPSENYWSQIAQLSDLVLAWVVRVQSEGRP